ncbi:SecDF P1 head subdomain-containing protein [Pseudomonas sp. IT-P253]|jgi:hypothetical protein|uniref:SecDF P1 head subdomain-containing protein n=1 Tax=Pseudomonas sp. IT-P253 TaxID=3026455 RepID=UPI0039E0AD12
MNRYLALVTFGFTLTPRLPGFAFNLVGHLITEGVMRGSAKVLLAVLGMMGALQCLAADIALSSASDFTEISLDIKRANEPETQSISLHVTLSPDAQRRMAQVTRENLRQPLKLFINGVHVSTATIQSPINGPGLTIAVPNEVARSLLPKLLEPSAI